MCKVFRLPDRCNDIANITEQVLAMGIVVVFFVGLIKLWVSNRHMHRLEELDAEKQMRMAQIQKSGVTCASSSNRVGGKDIPFGVKALENNIEVEGVWVARMASMASRPPERKWSSMRKVRSPSAASSLANARASRRASSKLSGSETAVPSPHPRNKLEDLSLLEEEHNARDMVPEHVGTLGKIQRGIKKMTSAETGPQASFGAKEFREGAQARRPQRFYPPAMAADTTAATPLMESQENKRPGRLVKKQSASRRQPQGRSSSRDSNQSRAPSLASTGSVEKPRSRERQRTTGPPSIPARVSSESARTSASRSSRRREHDATMAAPTHGLPTRSTGSMHRYPPNSSRSGGATGNPPRSRSFN